MIPVRAPCPVCGKAVEVENYGGTFVAGCIGSGVRSSHSVQLYGFATPEEAAREWDRLFESKGGAS